jgi:hypothetical protein
VYRTAGLASCGTGHLGAALSFMVMGEMFDVPAHKKEQQEHFRKNRWLKRKKERTLPLLHFEVSRIRIRALIIPKANIDFCMFVLF